MTLEIIKLWDNLSSQDRKIFQERAMNNHPKLQCRSYLVTQDDQINGVQKLEEIKKDSPLDLPASSSLSNVQEKTSDMDPVIKVQVKKKHNRTHHDFDKGDTSSIHSTDTVKVKLLVNCSLLRNLSLSDMSVITS